MMEIKRGKLIAGNWKMNLSLEEAKDLAAALKVRLDHHRDDKGFEKTKVILFPSSVYMTRLIDLFVNDTLVFVGAQNCHHEEQGAFTGEVAAPMIRSVGGTHVILGHSERRNQFKETDDLIALKAALVLKHGMSPVFCCGELLDHREAGKHFQVVSDQLKHGLGWMSKQQIAQTIIAYEPVWAIGTGKTASPEQAQEMHAFIRQLIAEIHGENIAANAILLYGGSCNARNAAELFSMPDVDGGLIGGASLSAADFFDIIQAAHPVS